MSTLPIEVTVYRGQWGVNNGQIQSQQPALYFSDETVAEEYARCPNQCGVKVIEPHVIKARIRIERPFIYTLDDAYLELSDVRAQLGENEAIRIAIKFSDYIYQTNNWLMRFAHYPDVATLLKEDPRMLRELYFSAYPFFSDVVEVDKLKQLGFDGVAHRGTGVSMTSVEYAVFDHSSVIEVVSSTTL